MNISYKIFNPAGNITALVLGDEYNLEQKKLINKKIMEKEPKVEQVGFLSQKYKRLTMAGGEFCGNATRCAMLYYIEGQQSIELEINNHIINAGINVKEGVWCEISIEQYKITKINKNIYKVVLKGITILVVKDIISYKNFKQNAKELINKYNLNDDAVGVMFVDRVESIIKMYPIVWVREIDTFFFENACGSGTIAVAMLESWLTNTSREYHIIQHSGETLIAEIAIKNNVIERAILKGEVKFDEKIREIVIEEELLCKNIKY